MHRSAVHLLTSEDLVRYYHCKKITISRHHLTLKGYKFSRNLFSRFAYFELHFFWTRFLALSAKLSTAKYTNYCLTRKLVPRNLNIFLIAKIYFRKIHELALFMLQI